MAVKIIQKNIPNTKIYLDSPLQCQITAKENRLILRGTAPVSERGETNWDKYSTRLTYFEEPELKGMKFKGMLNVEHNGQISNFGTYIELVDATEITLYFSAATSFNGFNRHPYLDGAEYENTCENYINNALLSGYEKIKADHIADHSALYNRTSFSLCDNNTNLTTDELLKQKNSNAIYEQLFNLGKYLTIAGSRKGGQALNLQGIWNERLLPPWNSNYTININTQMNYLPTLRLNLPECFEPYINLAEKLAINGRKAAKDWYGTEGIISHHNTDIWAMANPVGKQSKWCINFSFFNASFGWILWGLTEKFRIEGDMNYLKNTLYPLLCDCADTYIKLFVKDESGRYALSPATSPENMYLAKDKTAYSLAPNTAIVNAICRDTLKSAAEFSELLGNAERAKHYKYYAENIVPYKISSDGRILEWDKEYEEKDIHHRHVSHLYGLHPAGEISPEKTPDLAAAAEKSLNVRMDEGTGWCIAWKANMWARLKNGNRALKLIDNQLSFVEPEPDEREKYSCGGSYPNLLCAHPPFQIDGNFGATAAIIEMLVQCDDKNVYLLPALPNKWKSGEIKGIRINNGAFINIKWENGKVLSAEITPKNKAKEFNLIYE